jgi:hypothetical protein
MAKTRWQPFENRTQICNENEWFQYWNVWCSDVHCNFLFAEVLRPQQPLCNIARNIVLIGVFRFKRAISNILKMYIAI